MKSMIQYACIGILSVFSIWMGVIPALTTIDTDFPNYYTASRLLVEGRDVSRIYDDQWFQDQINGYQISQPGKFSPFPPVTAFIMIPIAFFAPLTAFRIWTMVNIGALISGILLLADICRKDWRWSSMLILGSGIGLLNNFRFGQFYLILTLLILLGYYFGRRGQLVRSGLMFGIGAAFKYFPLIFLPLFIMRKEWKLVAVSVFTVITLYSIGLFVFGIEVYKHFFTSVLIEHLSGNIQNSFSAVFQSWNSLFLRIFVYDAALNPSPVLNLPSGYGIMKYALTLVILSVTSVTLYKLHRLRQVETLPIQFSVIAVMGMLLLPASATY